MPKVLHVIGMLDPGGVETWLISLFREIRPRGVESAICALGSNPGSLEPVAAASGAQTFRCPLYPILSFPDRFAALLRDCSVQVLHSHVHGASGWLLWLARRAGVPVRISHSHTTSDGHRATLPRRMYRAIGQRLILRHATAGIAASSSSARALFGKDWRADPRLRVIHNGIDLAPFARPVSADDVRRDLGFPPDVTVIGHIGRFHAVKNQAFFLRVAEVLARRDPRIRFLFVGQGPLRGDIERRVRELGIEQLFRFLGGPDVDVPQVLAGCVSLMLFPSLWEGLPVALIEAQAAGVPILASASITDEVAVVPGLVAFLSLQEGPERWADEAQRVINSPRPSATQAREHLAQTDFDIRQSARDLLAIYAAD